MSAFWGSIVSIPFAVLTTAGIAIYLKPEAQQLPYVGLGLWFIFLITFVMPYKIWAQQKRQIVQLVGALHDKYIKVDWRVTNGGNAEVILTNQSTKSISNVELTIRHWKHADGTHGEDILTILKPTSGKDLPLTLNPNDPNYFLFACVRGDPQEGAKIAVAPGYPTERQFSKKEIGLKLGLTGGDVWGAPIDFRIKLTDDRMLVVEPWEPGGRAMSGGDIGI